MPHARLEQLEAATIQPCRLRRSPRMNHMLHAMANVVAGGRRFFQPAVVQSSKRARKPVVRAPHVETKLARVLALNPVHHRLVEHAKHALPHREQNADVCRHAVKLLRRAPDHLGREPLAHRFRSRHHHFNQRARGVPCSRAAEGAVEVLHIHVVHTGGEVSDGAKVDLLTLVPQRLEVLAEEVRVNEQPARLCLKHGHHGVQRGGVELPHDERLNPAGICTTAFAQRGQLRAHNLILLMRDRFRFNHDVQVELHLGHNLLPATHRHTDAHVDVRVAHGRRGRKLVL